MSEVTRVLSAIDAGDPKAAERLLPLVYDELRRLADYQIAKEKPGQTLQATALVHEAYLNLVGGQAQDQWSGQGHFFAAAAEAMRRILIANARRKKAQKRGGQLQRVDIDPTQIADLRQSEKLVALDEALSRLEQQDAKKAQLVKLRFFAGLTIQQTALALGISTSTADRYWTYARAWLQREMTVHEE